MNSIDPRSASASAPTPRERLIRVVQQILGAGAAASPMPIDARFSELGLNSIKMVSLMLAIETEFELEIPQDDITPENFTSIETVEAMIETVLSKPPN